MLTVGLTGGIASGKTTVSDLFAKLQVPIIDTDVISRQLLEPGELAYQQLRDHFGERIITANGRIDRQLLREIVFTQPNSKAWLETMLHPLIYRRSHEEILANTDAVYLIAVIPLLFEANFQALVDRILVVDCPSAEQFERLLQRDRIDSELAHKMLAQQLDNSTRVAQAHDVIDNSSPDADLTSQVSQLHRQYLQLAAN